MPASSYQQQKLRVCEVCSAYLGIHDNDRRLADHFGGKLHLGFIKIREKLAELEVSVYRIIISRVLVTKLVFINFLFDVLFPFADRKIWKFAKTLEENTKEIVTIKEHLAITNAKENETVTLIEAIASNDTIATTEMIETTETIAMIAIVWTEEIRISIVKNDTVQEADL